MGFQASFLVFLYVALTVLSILITYILSVTMNHVTPFVPYLSYIGDKPLESTIFTQLFVIDAAVLMLTVQVRFVQAFRYLDKVKASDSVLTANFAGCCVGHAAALGLFVMACFQESNAYWVHHLAGVFLYFFGSLVYFVTQTVVSNQMASTPRDGVLLTMRIALATMMVIFFLAFEVGYLIAINRYDKPWEKRNEWSKEDDGWIFYIVSASSQWLMLTTFQLYILTFYFDFKNVILMRTRIVVVFESENSAR